jgi:hypothetical protein
MFHPEMIADIPLWAPICQNLKLNCEIALGVSHITAFLLSSMRPRADRHFISELRVVCLAFGAHFVTELLTES